MHGGCAHECEEVLDRGHSVDEMMSVIIAMRLRILVVEMKRVQMSMS